MSASRNLYYLLLNLLLGIYVRAAVDADKITSLGGMSADDFPSSQYSGYLSFNDPDGSGTQIHIHYWFSLSEGLNPSEDPLIYWSNVFSILSYFSIHF